MPKRSKAKVKQTRDEKIAQLIEKVQPLPAVLALPHYPTRLQKQWWNKYIGDPFRNHISSKGNKTDNAVIWVHDIFVQEFCEEKYPQLTEKERKQYYDLIGGVLIFSIFFLFPVSHAAYFAEILRVPHESHEDRYVWGYA